MEEKKYKYSGDSFELNGMTYYKRRVEDESSSCTLCQVPPGLCFDVDCLYASHEGTEKEFVSDVYYAREAEEVW